MFYYFGFGSNMNLTSLRAKGVEPLWARRATLYGWRLRFNVQHFFRALEGGVGNIEYTGDAADRVLGVVYACPDESLAPLDAVEAYGHGYDRIQLEVTAETGEGRAAYNSENLLALTYVGMPEFIDDRCLPCRRYLNILLAGARQAGLDAAYVRDLSAHPLHQPRDYPPFVPPATEVPSFTEAQLKEQPLHTALHGAVFDMSQARPLHTYLKGFFGGRDMTLFHLKRLDSSDGRETLDDIRHGRLNEAQRRYLNAYLNEYAREYRYVGRFEYS